MGSNVILFYLFFLSLHYNKRIIHVKTNILPSASSPILVICMLRNYLTVQKHEVAQQKRNYSLRSQI